MHFLQLIPRLPRFKVLHVVLRKAQLFQRHEVKNTAGHFQKSVHLGKELLKVRCKGCS